MNKYDSITLFPARLEGQLEVPTSKSLTHRALICAALAKGTSTISDVVLSDDIRATLSALEQIGARIEINDDSVDIRGIKSLKAPNEAIDCNESGSTLRFLIPLLSLTGKEVVFTGKPSLLRRPQSVYEDLFRQDHIVFEHDNDKIVVNGSIKARRYFVDGTVSSQFFTGLMFALPLLNEDSYIHIKGHLESRSYIQLTIQMLEHFGVTVTEIENGYYIPGNQSYEPFDYRVEGDYSQAAFFLVGGILNGNVTVHNLSHESRQGDQAIIDIIKRMKGRLIFMEDGLIANKSTTNAAKIDIADCPDLGPIVALLGSLSKGTTTIVNAGRLRLKESDRIESTVATLQALGANIRSKGDEIIIHGKSSLTGGTVDSYNDHRIAMMVAIASIVSEQPIVLHRANAVTKSYPHFFDDFRKLGGSFLEGVDES